MSIFVTGARAGSARQWPELLGGHEVVGLARFRGIGRSRSRGRGLRTRSAKAIVATHPARLWPGSDRNSRH